MTCADIEGTPHETVGDFPLTPFILTAISITKVCQSAGLKNGLEGLSEASRAYGPLQQLSPEERHAQRYASGAT